ncbi:hypothetical protein QEN19_004380 [Hanseniaspora menglaensis]
MSDNIKKLSASLQNQIKTFQSSLNESQISDFIDIIDKIVLESISQEELVHKSKKAKLDSAFFNSNSKTTLFQLKNCSVISPIRKKLNFSISFDLQNKWNSIVLSNIEDVVQLQIENTKNTISFAIFLPVIERDNMSYLLIKYDEEKDPLIISLNKADVVKQLIAMQKITTEEEENVNQQYQNCIDYIRKQAILTGFKILDPFSIKNEYCPSFLVNSHIKSKEGTLYFLPDHLLFGIKKPILILPIASISSINYSTITRLTFSLTLILENESVVEFSMIDQQEYDRINSYIVNKHVNDKSMSNELKAKANVKQESKGDLSAAIKEDDELTREEEEEEVEEGDEKSKDKEKYDDSDDPDDADYEANIDDIDGSEASSDYEADVAEEKNNIKEEGNLNETDIELSNVPQEEDDEEDSGVDYD